MTSFFLHTRIIIQQQQQQVAFYYLGIPIVFDWRLHTGRESHIIYSYDTYDTIRTKSK